MDSKAAPVEVSCSSPDGIPPAALELMPLSEGSLAWRDEKQLQLTRVPPWMLGAILVRGAHRGPAAGSVLAVRAAAPSVVYIVVEEELTSGGSARAGGLLPSALPAERWERREEAPECGPESKLAVYARRVAGSEILCLPPFSEPGAVFFLVVKVDVEAFDASVWSSGGVELGKVKMAETVIAWSDCQNRYTWVPSFMAGGTLFRGPNASTRQGTVVHVCANRASRAYVIVEAENKDGQVRSGGYPVSLATEGEELSLPPTVGSVVFSIVVVNVASSPERLAQELKRSFRAWDANGFGGIEKADLDDLLGALCPGMTAEDRGALLAKADRAGTGKIAYEDFIDRITLA